MSGSLQESRFEAIFSQLERDVTSWWLREIRENQQRLCPENRAKLTSLFRSVLGHHHSSLRELLQAARVLEQPLYRRKKNLTRKLLVWLLPAASDLLPQLCKEAEHAFDGEDIAGDVTGRFSKVVDTLTLAGADAQRASVAAAHALVQRMEALAVGANDENGASAAADPPADVDAAGPTAVGADAPADDVEDGDIAPAGQTTMHEPASIPVDASEALSWRAVISWAEALPAEDARWDECERTLEGLGALAAKKRDLRARVRHEALERRRVLDLVDAAQLRVEGYESERAYLKLHVQRVDVSAHNVETLAVLAAHVDALADALSAVGQARNLPSDTIEAEDDRTDRLRAARNSAAELSAGLEEILLREAPQRTEPIPSVGARVETARIEAHVEAAPVEAEQIGVPAPAKEESTGDVDAVPPVGERAKAPPPAPAPPQEGPVASPGRTIAEPDPIRPQPSGHQANPDHAPCAPASYVVAPDTQPPRSLPRNRRPDARNSVRPPASLRPSDSRLWDLLVEGDVAGAFWYQRCVEAMASEPSLVPSWIFAALQGSEWVNQLPRVSAGLAELVDHRVIGEGDEVQTLALAAALAPAIVHPETHLRAWLHVQGPVGAAVQEIVDAITVFANAGQALTPAMVAALQSTSERQSALDQARQCVRVWQRDAPRRTTKFQGATLLWRDGLQKDLAEIMGAVLDGRDQRAELQEWRGPEHVRRRIRHHEAALRPAGVKPVEFGAREQLELFTREAVDLASDVAVLSERGHSRDWLLGKAREFQTTVGSAAPRCLRDLRELTTGGDHVVRALASLVGRSVAAVLVLLRVPSSEAPPTAPTLAAVLLAAAEDAASLDDALAKRLLWYPDISPPPLDSFPSADATRLFGLLKSPTPDLKTAVEAWMERGRFDLARQLVGSSSDASPLAATVEQALTQARAELKRAIEDATAALERGVVDGYASGVRDELRAELSGELSALADAEMFDIAGAKTTLASVERRLAALRSEHLQQTRERWEDVQKQLAKRLGPAIAAERASFIQSAIDSEDVRVADEAIYQLEDRLNAHSDLTSTRPRVRRSERVTKLREFAREYLQKIGSTKGELAGLVKHIETLKFESISLPVELERSAIRKGWSAWSRLRDKIGFEGPLTELLTYLGFTLPEAPAINTDGSGASWRSCKVTMNDGGMCPVPQFGSACGGQYRILCVWERPGAEAISGMFHQIPREPTVLLYLGRLAEAQLLTLRNAARQHELTVICIDETLVTFLGGEDDSRLPALFDCTLPYAIVNPYTPFQAGDVPPEMYFGRREIAGRVKDATGSCIVYGGRQLGKSALLRKVQRDFHSPSQNHYATVIDVKLLGDPRAAVFPVTAFWPRLREEMQRIGFLPKKSTSDDANRICESIRAQCQDKESRLLLLLDEADNLLDNDARDGFLIVDKLRELMTSTNRRFKVVFAGLHNVQRFQGIPNQPLAHFGQAIQVGPLEPADAMDLVQVPLAALGYECESPHDVLRILSYTNYHPGLIQLFCHELVRQLNARATGGHPPRAIRREQVEAVYQKEQVREGIRERFDWTLALDTRYQAVAWALIHDQKERRSREPVTARRILELARDWWPAGFDSGLDELSGVLDEMCGLGVLVRADRGYRLRSPNVVRLIGDVEGRLLELSEIKPPAPFDAAQHHRPLSGTSRMHSPLTFDDERRVLGNETGLVLLFGSNALGMGNVAEALEGLVRPSSEGTAHVQTIPDDELRTDPRAWLAHASEPLPPNARAIFHARLVSVEPETLARTVEQAQRFCAEIRRRTQVVRIILSPEPEALAAWLAAPRHEALEDLAEPVYLKKWSQIGLSARVEQADSLGPGSDLLETTGGWNMLVEEVFTAAKGNDLKPGIDYVRAQLCDLESKIRRRFLLGAGLEGQPYGDLLRAILRYAESGEVRPELLPDLVELLREELPWLDASVMDRALVWYERLGIVYRSDRRLHVDPIIARTLQARR